MGWGSFSRSAVKALAAGTLHYTGLQGVLSRASRFAVGGRRVLILSYHRVVADFEAEARRVIPGLLVSRRTFERHLDELAHGGYDVVTLDEALEVIAGRRQGRRDVAVLTFDDGYHDVFEHAFPVLARRGATATVYLATGLVGTRQRFLHDRLYHLLLLSMGGEHRSGRNVLALESMGARAASAVDRLLSTRSTGELTDLVEQLEQSVGAVNEVAPTAGEILGWDQVRRMASAGIDFGAHTVRHMVLTHETEGTIERELADSKQAIERETGRPVRHFAYPNGYYDRRVVTALVRLGYHSAVTTEDRPNHVGGDPFRLRRKTLWENFSRGPFGYSSSLTSCHLDDVFTVLSLTRPVRGERFGGPRGPSHRAEVKTPGAEEERPGASA
ncbi:MAG: polysaccharide deacetylase family protein [Deltaproteobacteria bacterium]|nr:polysaccharide deacetylase family protein [Deltaproteobacteria bacterium]